MVTIEQLRYVWLRTGNLKRSIAFARHVLGLELVDQTERIAHFRSDYRDPSLIYTTDAGTDAIGLEVRDENALQAAEQALREAGYALAQRTAEDCADRKVKSLLAVES